MLLLAGSPALLLLGSIHAADKKAIQWEHGTVMEMKRETRVRAQTDTVKGTLARSEQILGKVDLKSSHEPATQEFLVYVLEDETKTYTLERPVALLGPRAHACDVRLGRPVEFRVQEDTVLFKEPNGKECKTWVQQRVKAAPSKPIER